MFTSAEDDMFVAGNVSTPGSDGTDAQLDPLGNYNFTILAPLLLLAVLCRIIIIM